VTAWVKPKAEPRVRLARSQKALLAYCAGRRACLLTKLPADSKVLEQLARKHRTLEIVSIGEDGMLSWGRGEEVGETLEPEEAVHFGQAISMLRADPEAPKPTRKGARPPPRLLRGYDGAEDLPSISRFVERALEAAPDEGFVRAELPTLSVPEKPKKAPKPAVSAEESAERQAKRARARAEARKKEEAAAAEKREELKVRTEAQRREAERRRREQMADEESAAANILEEVDGDDEGGGGDVEDVEDFDDDGDAEEDDGSDVLDLDA